MEQGQLNWIANSMWSIADEVLGDLYVRGEYRDVVLPMTVLRRLDSVLGPTKQGVIEMKARLDKAGITNQDPALCQAEGQAFYNTSKFTLRDLKARSRQQQLWQDFEAHLDGFSPNVYVILDNFEFHNQMPRLSKADVLGVPIEKFLDPTINLSPEPVLNSDGSVRLSELDNYGVGTAFEGLVRRFNEEHNEEEGEHWTPRDAVKLMANLLFLPIADENKSGTYLPHDGACGTGGVLTVAQHPITEHADERGRRVSTHLYGLGIDAETYAICRADQFAKGEGDEADQTVGGPEFSRLSNAAFPVRQFDFMLSNPPYGKSWKSDLKGMGDKKGKKGARFVVEHRGEEFSLVALTSNGQMMFLPNMLSKTQHGTKLGSGIAEVHNKSSLFTGDAAQGESNIRGWGIEKDWLEANVALTLNMFYDTDIATYMWVPTNRKPECREGKVQHINATGGYRPLRKNLGRKNCELGPEDVRRIFDTFLAVAETEQSKILPNDAFEYWKATVKRPLRHAGIGPERRCSRAGFRKLKQAHERAVDAAPVIRKVHDRGREPDPLRGLLTTTIQGMTVVVEHEPDAGLCDNEQVPLLKDGGIDAFLHREVLPYALNAWYDPHKVKIDYEVDFTRYFYKLKPLRSPKEIWADILAVHGRSMDCWRKL